MIFSRAYVLLASVALLLVPFVLAVPAAAPGTGCNKLPGATPKNCNSILSNYAKNETLVSCGADKRVVITEGDCSLVYRCPADRTDITVNSVVGAGQKLAYACRDARSTNGLISAASAVQYWGRICYMKAGK